MLCVGCRDDLPRLSGAVCPVCALPLTQLAPACGACLSAPPAFNATFAAFRYAFPVDRLAQNLKFDRRLLSPRFAIADFFAASLLAGTHPQGDVIVPVPLALKRLTGRGFNQALEIARPLAHALHLPLEMTIVVRERETVPQSLLPWRARRDNMRHAFGCHGDFSGKAVIVVDDVMTTGATLNAMARTLKDHGATHVTNWVPVRTVRH